ncbi:hypothetical protein V8E36_007892 [Tilletia maclaganii]
MQPTNPANAACCSCSSSPQSTATRFVIRSERGTIGCRQSGGGGREKSGGCGFPKFNVQVCCVLRQSVATSSCSLCITLTLITNANLAPLYTRRARSPGSSNRAHAPYTHSLLGGEGSALPPPPSSSSARRTSGGTRSPISFLATSFALSWNSKQQAAVMGTHFTPVKPDPISLFSSFADSPLLILVPLSPLSPTSSPRTHTLGVSFFFGLLPNHHARCPCCSRHVRSHRRLCAQRDHHNHINICLCGQSCCQRNPHNNFAFFHITRFFDFTRPGGFNHPPTAPRRIHPTTILQHLRRFTRTQHHNLPRNGQHNIFNRTPALTQTGSHGQPTDWQSH